jgi:hypothetical protein
MKFSLGSVVATPAALQALEVTATSPITLIARHAAGDWGAVCAEDRKANEDAVRHGDRILSAYTYGNAKFWVITEADRSSTCIMLPSDY